ncbi:MAG: DUF1194 domain-containing protein [Pseudomonadota bacterium]
MSIRLIVLSLCLFVLPFCAHAQTRAVDVELVIAVDVSGSMDYGELQIQRRGYVEAFRSPEVHEAISKGLLGAVAVMYVEWARNDLKRVIVPWTLLETPADALSFAGRLEAAELGNMRNTSITGAINYGVEQLDTNSFDGSRRVLDISGDGPNNQGGLVTLARDEAVARGVIINGLPLVTEPWREQLIFGESGDLDRYFRACVIGGPGSFVIAVKNWEEFPDAVRRKLVLELAGPMPLESWVQRAQFLELPSVNMDCLIGEKRRRERERGDR